MGSGLMEPEGEGRPLLSLQDLESRLVFTRCKVSNELSRMNFRCWLGMSECAILDLYCVGSIQNEF